MGLIHKSNTGNQLIENVYRTLIIVTLLSPSILSFPFCYLFTYNAIGGTIQNKKGLCLHFDTAP